MADWEELDQRSEANLDDAEKADFDDAVCLHATREQVHAINLSELQALNMPWLETEVLLARGAKVMITKNLWQEKGLVNATIGTVEDVVWAPGAIPSDLPLAVLVSCKTYTGPTLWRTAPQTDFPNGIPIVPIPISKSHFEYGGKQCSRTQVPLRWP
ncbi:hypothetical protein DFH07DRAFT_969419 [Mycena maculata]|uniref:DNA helicase n=1 Tax=Mycena maculata TaxID=230809 RepID=A0AAD7MS77_9AGAR|nr:hypothetical protein DFH07DRAFT_969419 [Mycena maculata]